jgi:hypothetical protein
VALPRIDSIHSLREVAHEHLWEPDGEDFRSWGEGRRAGSPTHCRGKRRTGTEFCLNCHSGATAGVDVEEILESLAAKNPQKLNWRTSIVDLMKLVGMESSLAERKELARELGYTGDLRDSAGMNIWLHKQVLRKLAENGGKVPADLLD